MTKYLVWLTAGIFTLTLVGCKDEIQPEVTQEISRPVPIVQLSPSHLNDSLRFPARVRATQRAELAFKVSGQITSLPLEEGQKVKKGELVAQLDSTNYQNLMRAAKAKYDKAKADYQRVKELYERSQAVAKADVDKNLALMQVAETDYALAKQNYDDTRLTAPFSGTVTKRYVENYSNLQDKQPVLSLQDLTHLEVVINVPERLVRTANSSLNKHLGYVVFADQPQELLPVSLKSFSAVSDSQTQSYEVVLTLHNTSKLNILPGMSAEFLPKHATDKTDEAANPWVKIPLQAVYSTADKQTGVWVFNPETSRAHLKIIQLGEVINTQVVVTEGLTGTEQIVTAGLSHLRDGILVRPL